MTTTTLTPIQTELLNRADAIFDSVAKTVNQARDFAVDQVPDIAVQYLMWGRGSLTVYVIMALILIIVGLWLTVKISLLNSRNLPSSPSEPHFIRFIAGFSGVVLLVAGMIIILVNLNQFLMVWFAPKIWLITEMVNLVKQ